MTIVAASFQARLKDIANPEDGVWRSSLLNATASGYPTPEMTGTCDPLATAPGYPTPEMTGV